MKMRAAILVESRAPLVVEEIEIPKLDVGQVLVKIYKSGICGAQINEINAIKGTDKFLPHLLGHEGGAEVLEVGPGVTHVKPGDHVVLHWRKGNGIHAKPATYKWNGKTVNAGWVTTFQEMSVVSENRVTPIAKDINFEIAALMGCAVTTALGIINNDANVKIGESVVVFGCGGVGLQVVQGATMVSADPIVGIDIKDDKLVMVRDFGASHTLNSTKCDVMEEVRKIVGQKGADVVVETTGNVKVIEQAYNLAGPKGRVILVGVPPHDKDITIHSLPLHFGRVLTGCEGGHCDPPVDIPRYLNLYKRGKLELDKLISHRYTLDEVNIALDKIRSGEAARCMLQIF